MSDPARAGRGAAGFPALAEFFRTHFDAAWGQRHARWEDAARDYMFSHDTAALQAVLRELTALNHLDAADAQLEIILLKELGCHADFAAAGGAGNWVRWLLIRLRNHLGDELSQQAFQSPPPASVH
jgi:hypothetical protein